MTERDTAEEFDAQCGRLISLLPPALSDSARWNLYNRTMRIELTWRQVDALLEELALLAQYKASTEAAKRRSQDPDFMAGIRADIEARDRELRRLRTINDATEGPT